jgi:hypothetical protein
MARAYYARVGYPWLNRGSEQDGTAPGRLGAAPASALPRAGASG